jgi:hypothetical protein
MSAETVRKALTGKFDSPVEVGTYRGVDGVWAKVELDPRIDNSMRPTSLACDGTTVEEMKVRFVATTAARATVLATLEDLAALTPAAGEVSAENHDLSAADELWPHIRYEGLALSEAATCLAILEAEPLPAYRDE